MCSGSVVKNWGLGVLVTAVLVLFGATPSVAHADELAAEEAPKVAIGFSNLVARLESEDEIGFARPEYRVHILEALRAAGFNAVGAESLVFSRDDSQKAELVLGGTVKELTCKRVRRRTTCRVGISWEVLDLHTDRVVYRVLTRHLQEDVAVRNSAATGKALVLGALRSLMKRERFTKLMNERAELVPKGEAFQVATFKRCQAPERELPKNFVDAANASVLIKSKQGFGSGFFLGSDGLILSAAHLVAGESSVDVKLQDGTALRGRVVRWSPESDAALVSVSSTQERPCLALQTTLADTGSDVYAIGAPASQDLAFSLTRGIVSGVRVVRSVRLIQTDASVSPGNSGGPLLDRYARVLGIVSRKLAGQAVEGVAFGVALEDALTALKLEPADVTSAGLLQSADAPARKRRAPEKVVADVSDPQPGFDPIGERQRLAELAEERRYEERNAARPAWWKPVRIGSLVLVGVGGVGVTYTYATADRSRPTHAEWESSRLKNDVSWAALLVGLGGLGATLVLDAKLPPARVASHRLSVKGGPSDVQVQVTF